MGKMLNRKSLAADSIKSGLAAPDSRYDSLAIAHVAWISFLKIEGHSCAAEDGQIGRIFVALTHTWDEWDQIQTTFDSDAVTHELLWSMAMRGAIRGIAFRPPNSNQIHLRTALIPDYGAACSSIWIVNTIEGKS